MGQSEIRLDDAVQIVRRIAGKMRVPGHLFEDAVGDGLLGVAEARHRFDPSKGVAFWTFASAYARGYILHGMRRHKSLDALLDCDTPETMDAVEDAILLHEVAQEAQRLETAGVNGLDMLDEYLSSGALPASKKLGVHLNTVRLFRLNLVDRLGLAVS